MLVEHTTNMENHQQIQLGTAHPSNVPCIFPQKMTTKSIIWLGTLSSSFAPHFFWEYGCPNRSDNTDAQIAPNRSNPQILTRVELKIKPIVHPVTIKSHELPLINKSPFYGKSFGTPPIFSIPIPSDRGRPGHVDSAAE